MMKLLSILLLAISPMIFATSDRKDDSTFPVAYLINEDVTITVPSSMHPAICPNHKIETIQDALSCLDESIISPSATVKINVTQHNSSSDTINVKHPNGDRIHIVGNCIRNTACVLQFKPGKDGVIVKDGHTLGLLANMLLIGNVTAESRITGILASSGGTITLGDNVEVKRFTGGITAMYNSHIVARGRIVSRDNAEDGFLVFVSSSIEAEGAKAEGNINCDFYARDTSGLWIRRAEGDKAKVCADSFGVVRCDFTRFTNPRAPWNNGGLLAPENCGL